MTLEEIKKALADIEAVKHDPEAASSREFRLMRSFISYVATLPIPIAEKAKEVLKSNDIDFDRY